MHTMERSRESGVRCPSTLIAILISLLIKPLCFGPTLALGSHLGASVNLIAPCSSLSGAHDNQLNVLTAERRIALAKTSQTSAWWWQAFPL